jgi:hypothetical protein
MANRDLQCAMTPPRLISALKSGCVLIATYKTDPDKDWNVIGGQGSGHFHRYQQLGETDTTVLSETITKIFQILYLLLQKRC